MLRVFACVSFLLMGLNLFAQIPADTIYYDARWEICTKQKAAYYRISKQFKNDSICISDYYMNGNIQMEGVCSSLNPDVKNGLFKYYYPEGHIESEANYINDTLEGVVKSYFKDTPGKIQIKATYVKGIMHGDLKSFYRTGQIKRREVYEQGEVKRGKCYGINGDDTTYFLLYQLPEFKVDIEDYFSNKVYKPIRERYLPLGIEIEGRVMVKFVVTVDNRITDIEIEKNETKSTIFESMLISAIKNMEGQIECGRLDGETYERTVRWPILFKLID